MLKGCSLACTGMGEPSIFVMVPLAPFASPGGLAACAGPGVPCWPGLPIMAAGVEDRTIQGAKKATSVRVRIPAMISRFLADGFFYITHVILSKLDSVFKRGFLWPR